jgi:hypothetical protein
MARRKNLFFATAMGVAASFGGACYSGGPTGPSADTPDAAANVPFEPQSPYAYVPKVKNVLVGTAATDDEIKQVVADPKALATLIDGWMTKSPDADHYQAKMLVFFARAFQQSQISTQDFTDQLPFQGGIGVNRTYANKLLLNVRESFARTAWAIVRANGDFSSVITTDTYMMTPPLAALYAFLDSYHMDDALKVQDRIIQANPQFQFIAQSSGTIAITDTLNPSSPNYMHWVNPIVGNPALDRPGYTGCTEDPRTYVKDTPALYNILFGGLSSIPSTIAGSPRCQVSSGIAATATTPAIPSPAQFTDAEFTQWRPIKVRKPNPGEATTRFYDLPTLRNATEIVVNTPRISFFSTPAFFAQWPTNSSNDARVTINQTLITALGRSFDDRNSITPVSETGLSTEHAAPGTICYECHKTLDPMRDFFRQAYTIPYREQTDPSMTSVQPVFAFAGAPSVQGKNIQDLATQLRTHPRLGIAWAQKLCYYVASAPCSEDDPEFLRIVDVFTKSGFNWNALVRELLSSPIVTYASETKTADDIAQAQGSIVVSIARRDHLCAGLSYRLGIDDICGISGQLGLSKQQTYATTIAGDMPADGYSRGAEAPVLANDPTLFFRAGIENLCRLVAAQVVDAPGVSKYSSAKPDVAIADFVANVADLAPSDPHAADVAAVLHDHYTAGIAQKMSPTAALQSTFVLACMSPSAIGMGM